MCDAPCVRDCPGRRFDCHATCEKYKQYTLDREAFREKKRRVALVDAYYGDLSVDINTGKFANRRKRGQGIWNRNRQTEALRRIRKSRKANRA